MTRRAVRHVRDARGAVAIIASVSISFVLLPMAAFAVDLGLQRVARRDAQGIADAVAIEMASRLGACPRGQAGGDTCALPTDADAMASAAVQQRTVAKDLSLKVYVGHIDKTTRWTANSAGQGRGCPGRKPYDATIASSEAEATATPYFQKADDALPANAVLVTASAHVDFTFSAVMDDAPSKGGVCRSAIAVSQSSTCFTVGSWLANLSNASGLLSILNPILAPHDSLDLTAVGYQGLAAANVDLPVLNAGLISAGYPAGILSTDVRVGKLLEVAATALVQGQPTADVEAAADLLVAIAHATTIADLPIAVATSLTGPLAPPAIIDLSTQQGAVVSGTINALDLLGGAIFVADGSHLLDASLPASIPGVTHLHTETTVIEQARAACGVAGATAQSAQVSAHVDGTILDGGRNVRIALPPLADLNIGIQEIPLAVNLAVAKATGVLGDVTCAPVTTIPIDVTTGTASLSMTAPITINPSSVDLDALIPPALRGLVSAKLYVGDHDHWTSTAGSPGGSVLRGYTFDPPVPSLGTAAVPPTTKTWVIPPESYSTVKSTGPSAHTIPDVSLPALPTNDLVWTKLNILGALAQDPGPEPPVLSLQHVGWVLANTLYQTQQALMSTLNSTLSSAVGTVAGAVNGVLTGTVRPALQAAVGGALNPLFETLQRSLGLRAPGADVTVTPKAVCNQPVQKS